MPDTVEELRRLVAATQAVMNLTSAEMCEQLRELNDSRKRLDALKRGVFLLDSPEAFCIDVASLYGFNRS
jgi:ATP/maltotriose-dependent transcriptional regulator MalT